MTKRKAKICLAIDGQTLHDAKRLTALVGGKCRAIKVHDLLDEHGPNLFYYLTDYGAKEVWVDYKLHDTKDTVGLRVAALVKKGAKIITVHASGGVPMMEAAVKAAGRKCRVWAITLLTSLDDEEIAEIYGRDRTRLEIVIALAKMAKRAGAHGVVCSAQEVGALSRVPELVGLDFVVPGTRSEGVALGQQKRSGTPAQAKKDGATVLVAGSQVTKADDPRAAFLAFEMETNSV